MIRFLIDAQLPVALAKRLQALGFEAVYVTDIGLEKASDSVIWQYALTKQFILISKDEDFAQRKILANSSPKTVWVRIKNTRKQALIAWFEGALSEIIRNLENGETLIELV